MKNAVNGANHLKPEIWKNREITERDRKLAPEIVEGLVQFGLCRLGLPKEMGGLEDDPSIALEIYEELASVEASVAWIVWNNHLACTFGRFLDDATRDLVFGRSTHIYANSTRPEGVARVVDNGYTVSGKWTLVSGCELSDWFVLRCAVQPSKQAIGPGPDTQFRLFFVPSKDVRILDTWHVGGLRGTGSHDIEIVNAEVPENRSVAFNDPVLQQGHYARLPIGCMNAAGCAAIALGIARASLDALTEMGIKNVTPGKNPDLRDRQPVQMAVATTAVQIAASRAYLYRKVQLMWNAIQKSNPIEDRVLAEVWAASHNAAVIARDAVTAIYAAAGTASLYKSSPIERAHRDIHAVLQHGIIQPHWMNQVGMVTMGLEPTAPMFRI